MVAAWFCVIISHLGIQSGRLPLAGHENARLSVMQRLDTPLGCKPCILSDGCTTKDPQAKQRKEIVVFFL
ncbi:unnamed protein product [Protopolystoma xenopodis]|uniref:Secreted protein n=1 Tax=Protopolystoma xenopodis TaxID=117903 RepID=A0A448X3L1_9PLAT|nr:unnamed protein product [Protopolystoma xenopodis]